MKVGIMRSTVIRRNPPKRIMTKPRWFITVIILTVLMAIVFGLAWWFSRPPQLPEPTPMATLEAPTARTKKVNHLFLGNPSKATADGVTNGNNFLIERPQYVLSYNNAKRIPNWVSWQLNQSWVGTTPRQNNFRPDEALPSNWYKVKSGDYNGSGYDRGHMIPSADRDNNLENQGSTFFMTNILPQAPDNNQGPWAKLEEYCRELTAKQGKELYIVAGSYGNQGTIGKTQKVVVPESVWKVIVVMDQVGQRAKSITDQTRVIAVEMPNQQGIKEQNWRNFRVSVDAIEAKTGYDFLSAVPVAIQATIESKVDR
jgi:endonuclease G, mitochondrial